MVFSRPCNKTVAVTKCERTYNRYEKNSILYVSKGKGQHLELIRVCVKTIILYSYCTFRRQYITFGTEENTGFLKIAL